MTAVRVDIDSLTFNIPDGDVNGVRWMCGTVDGWDGAASDQSLSAMASQDGAALGRSMLGARSLVLDGTVVAPTDELHWAAYNTLLAAVGNTVTPRWITVHEPTPKRVAYVRRSSPSIRFHNGRVFEFQVDLVALDPRKYAVDPTEVIVPASSSLIVTGQGNYATPATVTTGGTVDLLNETTGQRLSTSVAVPSGTVFDGSARTVTGADFGALAPGFEWLDVIPGAQTITNAGSSAATITYHDAWL